MTSAFEDAPRKDNLGSSRVLLCEGAQDAAFFRALIQQRSLPPFDITYPSEQHRTGGRNGFAERLRSLRFARGYREVRAILVVTDHDDDHSLRAVRSQIQSAGLTPPETEWLAVPQYNHPAIVIAMLPSINRYGSLDTLCLESIRHKHPQSASCVDQLFTCADMGQWPPAKREKAMLRILLSMACKNDPNTGLQYAWAHDRGNPIPLDHPCFNEVTERLSAFDALL